MRPRCTAGTCPRPHACCAPAAGGHRGGVPRRPAQRLLCSRLLHHQQCGRVLGGGVPGLVPRHSPGRWAGCLSGCWLAGAGPMAGCPASASQGAAGRPLPPAALPADVTSGVTTREAVKQRDPQLASLLARVYGDGGWRYAATAPRKLGTRRRHGSRAGGGISNSGSGGIFQPYRITRAAARFAAAACCLQS